MLKPSCRARSTSRMPGPVSRATTRMPARGRSSELDGHLAVRRRTARCCGPPPRPRWRASSGRCPGEPGPDRELACGLAGRDDVGVGADRHVDLVVARPAPGPAAAGSAWRTARTRAGAGRRRPRRWRRRSALDRASSTGRHRSVGGSARSRARRYSTRSRARVRLSWAATAPAVLPASSARDRVAWPLDLVGQQDLPLPVGQPPERLGDGGLLLGGDDDVLGLVRLARVVHAVPVAGVPVLAPPHGRHDVARRGDGVRLDHPRLDAVLAPSSTRTRVSCTRSSAAGC